jgi:hypothetical protein
MLHIAPGLSAGGELRQALRRAGRSDEVLACCDDLSCGPIDPDSPSVRLDWWRRFDSCNDYDSYMVVFGQIPSFWDRVTSTDEHLVVWFGRHSATELAFFSAWADKLGDRPYDIVDVTGREKLSVVSIVNEQRLRTMLGSERPATPKERDEARRQWQRLRAENAPFRVVSDAGLVSAPIDHFDSWLLERATSEWRKAARIVGDAMGYNMEPYIQVGDLMLLTRIVALVEQGALEADGDPWDMTTCRLRLPRQAAS